MVFIWGKNTTHLQTHSYGLRVRCYLLCCELVCAHRDAVDKLHGTPQAVKLHTLVNVHNTVGGRRSAPHPVMQETADARQDDLEHGQAAAKALFGQQVPLTRNGNLLEKNPQTQYFIITDIKMLRKKRFQSFIIYREYTRNKGSDLPSAVWFVCLSVFVKREGC